MNPRTKLETEAPPSTPGSGPPEFRVLSASEAVVAVREGLPYSSFDSLQGALAVSLGELAGALRIAPRTLSRRKQEGRFDTGESERLYRLSRLLARAREVLGTADEARRWLTAPKRALGGATPLAYADTEPGAREVEDLLGRLEHGVFP